ncbi:hypothetical protein DFQ07_0089 [Tenacibaculum caenipelagi]|uniref:Uncharacterized protein n=1 Tax=Tenacibaculum caenipelagi TaxID=1325435 RepID=A0A4R6TNB5_9FLAO|nr:hypothetical protein DFQ07_0089 [Tenacibaculum caenipelagi]
MILQFHASGKHLHKKELYSKNTQKFVGEKFTITYVEILNF